MSYPPTELPTAGTLAFLDRMSAYFVEVRCLWIDPRSTGANPETSEQAIVKAEVTNMCL